MFIAPHILKQLEQLRVWLETLTQHILPVGGGVNDIKGEV